MSIPWTIIFVFQKMTWPILHARISIVPQYWKSSVESWCMVLRQVTSKIALHQTSISSQRRWHYVAHQYFRDWRHLKARLPRSRRPPTVCWLLPARSPSTLSITVCYASSRPPWVSTRLSSPPLWSDRLRQWLPSSRLSSVSRRLRLDTLRRPRRRRMGVDRFAPATRGHLVLLVASCRVVLWSTAHIAIGHTCRRRR